jgi:hypothetical protein
MSTDRKRTLDALAIRLSAETGVTVSKARELIHVLGSDWSSLVREARVTKQARSSAKNCPS